MEQIETLRALHDADHWIERVHAQREHLPELVELTALELQLREMLAELHRAETDAEPVRAAYLAARENAAKHARRASDLDGALATSLGSARELTAMQHELDLVRGRVAQAEDEELDLLMQLEPLDEAVAAVKARAQPGVARRGELRDVLKQLRTSLDEEIASLRVTRDELAGLLESPWRMRYDSALARVGISGAATVESGRCVGCRIALSPLDYDRFRRLEPGVLMDCPECGRVLLP